MTCFSQNRQNTGDLLNITYRLAYSYGVACQIECGAKKATISKTTFSNIFFQTKIGVF